MALKSFIGGAVTSVDGKGRTNFPKEFRKNLSEDDGDVLVITAGSNRSLILYTEAEWNTFMERLAARKRTPKTETFRRRLLRMATQSKLDGQNRISLTRTLMEYAQIESDVLFAAEEGKTVGLWNPDRYEELYGIHSDQDFSDMDEGFYWDETEGE